MTGETTPPTDVDKEMMAVSKVSELVGDLLELTNMHPDDNWMEEIIKYVQSSKLPEEDKEVDRVARRAKLFVLVDTLLYW